MRDIVRKNILRSILIKEFKQLFRDVRMRIVLFVPPVLMLIVFGYAATTDVTSIRMAVLDEDKNQLSRGLIERFVSSNYFLPARYLNSEKELVPLMDSGKVEVYIHLERGLSRRVKSGKDAAIQIIIDGTDSNRAAVIVSYVNGIVNELSQDALRDRIKTVVISRSLGGMRVKKIIQLKERVFFNPDLSSRNFFLPGVIGLLISLITVMLTSMSIVKERETGTIEQIIVSPIKPVELIAGKTVPFIIIGFVDIFIITIVAIAWFNVPFNGSFLFLLFSSFLYILSTIAVGLFISTISKTQQQSMLSFFLFFMPAILLSGFIFPIYSMPESIQVITYANPLRYFMTIIRGIFLKGVGFEALWKDIGALFIIGITLIVLSAKRFSKRLE
jgi:ABC-2 type transport system permease protein